MDTKKSSSKEVELNIVEKAIHEYTKRLNNYNTERQKIRDKIEQRKAQIKRLERKLDQLECPSWIDDILRPIAEAMLKELPGYDRFAILGPFGIGADTSIHFYKEGVDDREMLEGDNCLSITFTPDDLADGKLSVKDFTKNTGRFSPGTIGELNRMNYPNKPMVPDVGWLLNWLKSQNSETSSL
jgi:hypothetical protein